jgi:hypothetical protein
MKLQLMLVQLLLNYARSYHTARDPSAEGPFGQPGKRARTAKGDWQRWHTQSRGLFISPGRLLTGLASGATTPSTLGRLGWFRVSTWSSLLATSALSKLPRRYDFGGVVGHGPDDVARVEKALLGEGEPPEVAEVLDVEVGGESADDPSRRRGGGGN